MGIQEQFCTLSKLPVKHGDRVYGMLNYRNPRNNHAIHYICSDPVPLGLPFEGTYQDECKTLEDLEDGLVVDLLAERLDCDNLEEEIQDIRLGNLEVPVQTMVWEDGSPIRRTVNVTPRLVFIRKDIYEYLSSTPQYETMTDREYFADMARYEYLGYMQYLQNNLEGGAEQNPDFWQTHLRQGTGLLSAEDFPFDHVPALFHGGEGLMAYEKEWKRYHSWLFDQAEDGELVGNENAHELFEMLIDFTQLCQNMSHLGLTFEPPAYGPQFKRASDQKEYLDFLMGIIEDADDAEQQR